MVETKTGLNSHVALPSTKKMVKISLGNPSRGEIIDSEKKKNSILRVRKVKKMASKKDKGKIAKILGGKR